MRPRARARARGPRPVSPGRARWARPPARRRSAGHLALPTTEEGRAQLRLSAAEHASKISDLLYRVPRALLLLLKTNDCLRTVDGCLDQARGAPAPALLPEPVPDPRFAIRARLLSPSSRGRLGAPGPEAPREPRVGALL